MSDAFEDRPDLHLILNRLAPHFGLLAAAVNHLGSTAQIVYWNAGRARARSSDCLPLVHLLIRGAAFVEVLISQSLRSGSQHCTSHTNRPISGGILKLLRPGEFFCLPPSTRSHLYELRASAHPNSDGVDTATVAVWNHEAMRRLTKLLPADSYFKLLNASWLFLSRVSEEKEVVFSLNVTDRLRFILPRLARRFPCPHERGILIDLKLSNPFLGRLIGANRYTVGRSLAKLQELRELFRVGDLIVLPPVAREKEQLCG